MKLKVLTDNNTYIDEYYLGEPGLSIYIEEGDHRILFDTGYSDVFLKNAEAFGIDLRNIDMIILSHGHNDHTGGLRYLKEWDLSKVSLLAHPEVFEKRNYHGNDISSPVEREELKVKEYIDGTKPYAITDRLYFLGEIPRVSDFEGRPIGYKTLYNVKDYLKDDTALAYHSDQGIFIITACSHAGICNITEAAKALFHDDRILGIIGGFHLLRDNDQLEKTVEYFKTQKIASLYPSHCVCLKAKHRLYEVCELGEVGVGMELTIE